MLHLFPKFAIIFLSLGSKIVTLSTLFLIIWCKKLHPASYDAIKRLEFKMFVGTASAITDYCSTPYKCILCFILISAVLILGYYTYPLHMINLSDLNFIFLIFIIQVLFTFILWMVPSLLCDIISKFYIDKVNINALKNNLILRFICSDYFFDELSRKVSINNKSNKHNKTKISLIEIIMIIIAALIFVSIFIH